MDDTAFDDVVSRSKGRPRRFSEFFTSPAALARRRALSRWLQSARRSPSLRFATKCCFGCVALAVPALLPIESAGAQWFIRDRGQWIIVSFFFVLDVTTGGTMRVSVMRIIGTALGACVALLVRRRRACRSFLVACSDMSAGLGDRT
jgi:uncharacterized membrane protein YccC